MNRFQEPVDFMVFMHLFTFSYGFNRKDAAMPQAQLERFTGASKNTIKKSLERLESAGWIKCIGEYEHGRMARRWLIKLPDESPSPPSKGTVSNSDTVKNSQYEPATEVLSKNDSLTLSKFDTYKEPLQKNLKETPTLQNPALQKYFSEPMPFRKRESELKAYRELRNDFSEEQIAMTLEYLQEHGVPGSGERCHSPISFLAKAITNILRRAEAQFTERKTTINRELIEHERARRQLDQELTEEQALLKREADFVRAFPEAKDQKKIIAAFSERFPMLPKNGLITRKMAIAEWADKSMENDAPCGPHELE
jgi:DNA-binding Lrp family transcriptional regulator